MPTRSPLSPTASHPNTNARPRSSLRSSSPARRPEPHCSKPELCWLVHYPLAGLPGHVLRLDPLVGGAQAGVEGGVWLPLEHLLDEGVVAVAARHAPGRSKVVFTVELDPGDLLHL